MSDFNGLLAKIKLNLNEALYFLMYNSFDKIFIFVKE